jgi:MoaA/NifB/PqqE/SkfB family radical SAM enzyme
MLKYCSSAWDTIQIFKDGSVSFCLCSAWHNNTPAGNLHRNSLSEIINSTASQKFKNSIVDQSYRYCNKSLCPQLSQLQIIDNFDSISIPQLPTTLALAVDSNCNLKCASCRDSQVYSTEIDPDSKHVLDELCKEYRNFNQPVMIYGDGAGDCFASAAWREFLNRDDLPKCFQFNLTTNGNLLTKNLDIIKKIKPQLHSVIVSLDAATPETYKKIRGGNFDLVLDGVRELINLNIPVHTQFVLQYQNYQELIQYQQLTMELGTTTFGLQKLFRWRHMSDQWWLENQLEENKKIDQELLHESLQQVSADPRCRNGTGIDFFFNC